MREEGRGSDVSLQGRWNVGANGHLPLIRKGKTKRYEVMDR